MRWGAVRLMTSCARYAAVLAYVLFALFPLFWLVKISFTPGPLLYTEGIRLWPSAATLANYRFVLTGSHFPYFFVNSVIVSVATALAVTVLAGAAGYALSRFRFPGRRTSLRVFLFAQMFPGVVTTIPLYVVLEKLHLLNHLGGLVLCYATTAIPFCVFMLKGYFDGLPQELEEAVLLDGGSRFDAFYRVVLPLARPAISVTALFCFLTAWNEFILAATFMSRPQSYTLPVMLNHYVGDYATEWGHFAAGAVLVSMPVMALFYVVQKYLVGGLTAGAVKG